MKAKVRQLLNMENGGGIGGRHRKGGGRGGGRRRGRGKRRGRGRYTRNKGKFCTIIDHSSIVEFR